MAFTSARSESTGGNIDNWFAPAALPFRADRAGARPKAGGRRSMADCLTALGQAIDSLLGQVGIHNVSGLDASVYVLGATIFLGFCAAVPSAIRMAFLRSSGGR